jgi:hypothetical protein
VPRMKIFSSQEQPISSPAPVSLDVQLLRAQNEYDTAILNLHEMEADFEQQASVVSSDQFQKLESGLR